MPEKPSKDHQPKLPAPEEQERLLERFFGAVENYQKWVEESITFQEKELHAALQKPPGVHHVVSLYRDDEGRFWKITTDKETQQGVLYECVRPAGGKYKKYEPILTPYRPMDDIREMKRSLDTLAEDWSWEEVDKDLEKFGEHDSIKSSRADLDRNRFAKAVVEELLRQKDHIKQWLKEYALESDRHTYSEASDLDDFYGRFVPALQSVADEAGQQSAPYRKELPDPSPVHAMLHMTLNSLAGHPDSRQYLY